MPNHLTVEERDRLAQLRYEKATQEEMALALGRSASTVSRELRRNSTGSDYYAGLAQRKAEERRTERPLIRKMDDPQINEAVRAGLAQEWSPQQIAGRLEQQAGGRSVSHETIYAWIKQNEHRPHWESHLRRRGKRPCRPKNPSLPGTGGVATLVDRKSRFTIIVKVQSKNADHVHEQIKQRLKELEAERCHSITFDNGTEFARCHRLEKHLGLKLYFADPGCPYQRGTNENTNGLIRQYFPKGTDFRDISHCQVRQAENKLNNRPRACLGFRTPNEVFIEKTPPTGCD